MGVVISPIKVEIPTEKTLRDCDWMNTDENTYSSQEVKNAITPTATSAGAAIGMTMRTSTPSSPLPSTTAASCISGGMFSKNPLSIQFQERRNQGRGIFESLVTGCDRRDYHPVEGKNKCQ